ncbi:MAG TPA: carboxypeptidase regulatory-like domain-containing protein [Candidatus Acidoferrales bacterium]|nr:carboxypeptidase regulatory-like domain-containing protein [Candidatus Acidoferrales bacterium]
MTTKFRMAYITVGAALLLAGVGAGMNARAGAAAPRARQAGATASGQGNIAGRVNFSGKPPQLRPILMTNDPVCASQQEGTALPEDGRVNANGTLPNAFVYISKGSGNLSVPAPSSTVAMTQKGCSYEPHVLGIQVGQRLQVTSEDPTTHNIHVSPKTGHDWNVSQQPGSEPVTTKFSHAEIMVPVHCNVHPWMSAYIGVVTNPYFAVTGADGSFTIKGVPPGDYTLSIWTATFGTQEHQVTVRAGETATADFTFEAK